MEEAIQDEIDTHAVIFDNVFAGLDLQKDLKADLLNIVNDFNMLDWLNDPAAEDKYQKIQSDVTIIIQTITDVIKNIKGNKKATSKDQLAAAKASRELAAVSTLKTGLTMSHGDIKSIIRKVKELENLKNQKEQEEVEMKDASNKRKRPNVEHEEPDPQHKKSERTKSSSSV